MKRSLPLEFFQQAPIYDNNERFLRQNVDKHSHYIEVFKKDRQNAIICRNDTTNVLSDIDSMLSDLNRELDQMLDYETTMSDVI